MKLKKIALTLLNIFGLTVSIVGIMICIIGIAMHFDTSSPHSQNGLPIALASMAFLLPGLLLSMISRRSRRRLEAMQAIAGIVSSYRRITLADLAARLMIPEGDAARLLALAITQNLVSGNFDRATGEFFTEEGLPGMTGNSYCTSCGSPFTGVVLRGETARCRSCGCVIS